MIDIGHLDMTRERVKLVIDSQVRSNFVYRSVQRTDVLHRLLYSAVLLGTDYVREKLVTGIYVFGL